MLRQWYVLLAGIGILIGGTVHAREVSIALDGAQMYLILSNPSTVSVNYDVTCHKADGSGTIISLTSQTLAPNSQAKHAAGIPDSGTCSGGAAPYSQANDALGKPFYFCSGANPYASAGSACGVGNTFCFPEVPYSMSPSSCSLFYLKTDGSSQFNSSCSGYVAVTGGQQVVVGNYQPGYARKSSSSNACSYFYHASEVAPSTSAGAVCCSSPQSGSVCKVIINTTSTNAYLSSPSFMGGAAF